MEFPARDLLHLIGASLIMATKENRRIIW